MKLDNFKELLLKKASNNANLQTLIKYMRDEYLVDHIVESLEKMSTDAGTSKSVNSAILRFAKYIDPEAEIPLFHDALSHHASHYKAALEAGDEKLADKHMSQLFHIMYLGQKMTQDAHQNHTSPTKGDEDAKLRLSFIDPKPWERAGFANQRDDGSYKTDTHGFKRNSSSRKDGQSPFFWLRGAPSADKYRLGDNKYAEELAVHGHTGAYPLEEITVNDKHIHVDDVEYDGEFKPHPFDSHPIFEYYRKPIKDMDAKSKKDFIRKKWAYQDGEEFTPDEGDRTARTPRLHSLKDFWDMVNERNPEDHASRGSKKSKPIHKKVQGLDVSQTKHMINQRRAQGLIDEIPQPKVEAEPAKPKTIRKPGADLDSIKAKLDAIKAGKSADEKPTSTPAKQETQAMLDAIKNKFKD